MQYHYLFGPVPSRRLGISLGVDLVPMKTCTLNCIYCECGASTHLTLARREYVPFAAVEQELLLYFENNPAPDYITFSGSGEPTLNSRIGDVLQVVKSRFQDIPTAVLTNGTLFSQQQVRKDIQSAAVIIPSLDAVTETVFRKINRPALSLKVQTIVQGLVRLRKEYSGNIWLEIFIVPGMNDTEQELAALKQAIERIEPDQVQINTLDRPGPVSALRSATRQELEHVLDFLQMENAAIIADVPEQTERFPYRKDAASAILGTIARRPCTLKDLSEILGLHPEAVKKSIDALHDEKKIKVVKQKRGSFYFIS